MSELERSDARHRRVLAEIAPVLEQLDGRALVVLEREHRADAREGIVAQFALDAVFRELARNLAEVGIRRDLERELQAALLLALVELDRELADLGGEEDAVFLALGDREAEELGVIVGLPREVGGLESRVSDAFGLDHNCPLYLPADGRPSRGPVRAERRLP